MTFKPDDKIMEMIWDNLQKTEDGEHAEFGDGDLEEIWQLGFVDTDRYSLDDWIKAFEPHKNPDGIYLLKKEDFLEKERYRYAGELLCPFQPILINEGKYTDEGLQELIDLSIAPSCSLSAKEIKKFFKKFKDKYRDKENLITMDMQGKREIAEILYENPSPKRRRELIFDAMFAQQIAAAAAGTLSISATPSQAAQVQISTFSTLPSTETERLAKELKKVEKKKPKATGSGDEGVEVRKIKKSRKGWRG